MCYNITKKDIKKEDKDMKITGRNIKHSVLIFSVIILLLIVTGCEDISYLPNNDRYIVYFSIFIGILIVISFLFVAIHLRTKMEDKWKKSYTEDMDNLASDNPYKIAEVAKKANDPEFVKQWLFLSKQNKSSPLYENFVKKGKLEDLDFARVAEKENYSTVVEQVLQKIHKVKDLQLLEDIAKNAKNASIVKKAKNSFEKPDYSNPTNSGDIKDGNLKITNVFTFIGSTDYLIDTSTPEGNAYAKQIYPFACGELKKKSPDFAHMYDIVDKKKPPHKMQFLMVKDEEAMTKGVRMLLHSEGYTNLDIISSLGSRLFEQNGDAMNPSTGKAMRWFFTVYFGSE